MIRGSLRLKEVLRFLVIMDDDVTSLVAMAFICQSKSAASLSSEAAFKDPIVLFRWIRILDWIPFFKIEEKVLCSDNQNAS